MFQILCKTLLVDLFDRLLWKIFNFKLWKIISVQKKKSSTLKTHRIHCMKQEKEWLLRLKSIDATFDVEFVDHQRPRNETVRFECPFRFR